MPGHQDRPTVGPDHEQRGHDAWLEAKVAPARTVVPHLKACFDTGVSK